MSRRLQPREVTALALPQSGKRGRSIVRAVGIVVSSQPSTSRCRSTYSSVLRGQTMSHWAVSSHVQYDMQETSSEPVLRR